jgi:hypothetical protein
MDMGCVRTESARVRQSAASGTFITGTVRCRECDGQHVAQAPFPEPGLDDLDCPLCGAEASCEGEWA